MNIIYEYFENWNNKDIDKLSEMFDENIILSDWVKTYVGKEDVIKANLDIFNSYKNLKLTVHHLGLSITEALKSTIDLKEVYLCEISVDLDGAVIGVVDVITLKNNLITEIKAYRNF